MRPGFLMACFELPIPAIKTVVWQYNLSFCYSFITYVSPYINNLNYFFTLLVWKCVSHVP